jgi:hypothetical protein
LIRVVSYLQGRKNLGIRFEKRLGSDGVVTMRGSDGMPDPGNTSPSQTIVNKKEFLRRVELRQTKRERRG